MAFRSPVAFLCLAAASCAWAAPQAWLCNSCTEAQFDAAALARAQSSGQSHGNIYEYDFNSNKLRKYEADREPSMGGGYTYSVWRVTPTNGEQSYFALAVDAWIDTNHTMKRTVIIHPNASPPGSPPFPSQVTNFINDPTNHQGFYGLVKTPQYQNYLSQYAAAWIANYLHVSSDPAAASVVDFISADIQMNYSSSPSLELTVKIDVPGGGVAQLTLSNDATGQAVWKLTKLTDRNNIDVPMTQNELTSGSGATNYDFGGHPTDIAPFEWYVVHGLGVPVDHVGGWTLACTISASGRHCIAQPN